jgi:hypothetical protein
MASLLLVLACTLPAVMAQRPTIEAKLEVPSWGVDSAMQLSLYSAGGAPLPIQYTVMPLTQSLGLNQTDLARGVRIETRSSPHLKLEEANIGLQAIKIEGNMVTADQNTYTLINQTGQVAYLSCDKPAGDGAVSPDTMLQTLMDNKPKAIVLYTIQGNWCSLSGSNLVYQSIFTMADSGDAAQALGYLNGTNEVDVVRVSITGNTTVNGADGAVNSESGNNSAVAMSILYSITGLITMLFLVIIATGAIRAHRYPERYGPRSGYGGRPRQSRAKGLARAVLETIPVVKFGNPQLAKPDPALELESQPPIERPQPTLAPRDRAGEEERRRESSAPRQPEDVRKPKADTKGAGLNGAESAVEGDEDLGCSICTEDFTVGEDVRVLPCSHKFHPTCIDPWLVNVSGTCPLW